MTEAEWHMIAASDDIVYRNGKIVGVVMDGVIFIFEKNHLHLTP